LQARKRTFNCLLNYLIHSILWAMNQNKFAAYFRVSSDSQGLHGLGMGAQESAVLHYLKGQPPDFSFREVESGKCRHRPQLARALACCRKTGATLVIAKLDRLSRNAHFLTGLMEAKVKFICCDMPEADEFMIGVMALLAQREAKLISQRTKAALAEAKRRGTVLGNPRLSKVRPKAWAARKEQSRKFARKFAPVLAQVQQHGATTLQAQADALNRLGYTTPTGKQFQHQSIKNLLAQVDG
jgi:DNA invertase Pin-like site-specific DNA recombinase